VGTSNIRIVLQEGSGTPSSATPRRQQDASQQLHFVISTHLRHPPPSCPCRNRSGKGRCILVIQQTHSSVSALTITSGGSLTDGRIAMDNETHEQASSEGSKGGKGGGFGRGRERGQGEGIDSHSSLLLLVVLRWGGVQNRRDDRPWQQEAHTKHVGIRIRSSTNSSTQNSHLHLLLIQSSSCRMATGSPASTLSTPSS